MTVASAPKRLVVACAVLTLAGCSSAPDDTVTILAASSLADVMPQIVALAEQDNPDETLEVSYAASSQIVQQLNAGIQADVAVLAGEGPLESVDSSVDIRAPQIIATNTLAIAVAPGNPGKVTSINDLGRDDLSLVVCAEQVPCGLAAAAMFTKADVTPRIASFEPDVRATLSRVASGEADVGVVYVTDLVGQSVDSVEVSPEFQVVNSYPALSVGDSARGDAFVDFLGSDAPQKVLRDAGFSAP